MKLKDIDKKYLIIGLIVIAGLIGMQYMAVFNSTTGVYWIEQTSYEANVGDTITVVGKVWVTEGGTYKLGVMKPDYFFVDNIASRTYGTITTAGYWQWSVPVKVTKSGEYVFYVILPNGAQAMGTESITVSAPGVPYEPPDEPPVTDPCSGVSCNDYCVGTTLYRDGYCVDGTCRYSKDYNSEDCGYVPPVVDPCIGISCGDMCVGTTLYHSGYCEDGSCQYEQTAQSKQCGYVSEPPEDDGDDVLTTIMLIMVLVLVLLGGVYTYIKR